jgi:hypothetical protein
VPVTLAQAQLNTLPDIDWTVIDTLRRNSWVLDQMVWDDTVTPGTGGGSLTYGYTRILAAAAASFRNFNEEYPASQATRQQFTVPLHPLGGSFTVDRTLATLGNAATNEIMFQLSQKITSVRTLFQQQLILGDTAVDAAGFDGLDKSLTGTNTEYLPVNEGNALGYTDWSASAITTEDKAMAAFDSLDDWLSRILASQVGDGSGGSTATGALPPGTKGILGNTKSIARLRSLARRASQFTSVKDDLGRQIDMYGQWVLVDMGDRVDGSAPIIPIQTRDPDGGGAGGNITGLTDLYAVSFGLDAMHGASVSGKPLIQTWLPDYSIPGAVKSGEVEMGPLAMVLRNTRTCGVFRNVKVS